MKKNNKVNIVRTSVHEQVYNYMKEAIESKRWDINEKIPPEVELAEMFGVNKITVRIALQQLIGIGVLEKRVGDGTYVKEFDFADHIQKITGFYMKPELLDQVCEFRRVIELECARLAIDRATPDELKKMKSILKEYRLEKERIQAGKSKEYTLLVEKDLEFHQQICIMSHNDLFLNSFEVAKEPISQYLNVIVSKRIDGWIEHSVQLKNWRDLHEEIYNAIVAKDYELCKKLYLDMIDREVAL